MITTQRKKLLKVKSEIESMFMGDIKRFGFTPYMIDVVLDVYGNLVNERSAETICEEVKNYFEKRKFTITTKGIGWIIS